MIRTLLLLLALTFPASAATLYPADQGAVAPVAAWGNIQLTTAYSSASIRAAKPGSTQDIGFDSSGALDTATLDTFRSGAVVNVSIYFDQIGSHNLTCDPAAVTSPYCPSIWSAPLANSRAIQFDAESSSTGSAEPFFGMASGDITALGCTAKDYAIVAVVQPSASLFVNQFNAPGIAKGALYNLWDTGGSVAQLLNNSNLVGSTPTPGWQVTDDGSSFSYIAGSTGFINTGPIVVTVISDANGVRIYQDERLWATSSRSGLTRTASKFYLGQLQSSVEGASNDGWGGGVAAVMLYCSNLPSQDDLAYVRAAFYSRFGLDYTSSTYNTNIVLGLGDSMMANYHPTSGLYGQFAYLQAAVTKSARFLNYGDPGSTVTINPDSPLGYASTQQLSALVCPVLSSQVGVLGRTVVIWGGGNDPGLTGTATPRNGTASSGSGTILVASTAGLTAGDYVYVTNTIAGVVTQQSTGLATIDSMVADTSITLSGGVTATVNGTVDLNFTRASVSPTAVMTAMQTSINNIAACGGLPTIIVPTILKRNAAYQPHIDATNALYISSLTGATVLDCASYGTLGTNPGANYSDSTHLSAPTGALEMESCLFNTVNNSLN